MTQYIVDFSAQSDPYLIEAGSEYTIGGNTYLRRNRNIARVRVTFPQPSQVTNVQFQTSSTTYAHNWKAVLYNSSGGIIHQFWGTSHITWTTHTRSGNWDDVVAITFEAGTPNPPIGPAAYAMVDNCVIDYVGMIAPEHGESSCEVDVHAENDGKTGYAPISLRTGEKRESSIDLTLNSPSGDFQFQRGYRQNKQNDTVLSKVVGQGWSHNHNIFLDAVTDAGNTIYVYLKQGGRAHFTVDPNDSTRYVAKAGGTSVITVDAGSTDARYTLTSTTDTYEFNDSGLIKKRIFSTGETWTYGYTSNQLTSVDDGYGNQLQFAYYSTSDFKDGLLKRVGDHTVTDINNVTTSDRYVEYDYIENKIEDSGNLGTVIDGGQALLHTVRDVRGNTWTYDYEQNDIPTLNWLTRITSPDVIDTTGDSVADAPIVIKDLDYTLSGSDITNITQKLGGVGTTGSEVFKKQIDYAFQPNGDNITTETVAGVVTTHEFNGEVYLGTKNALSNGGIEAVDPNYRTQYQEDSNGNGSFMNWSADGKNLESVTDANGNSTAFQYDSENRLIESTDAEGRKTEYTYSGTLRQPATVKVYNTDGLTVERHQEFVYDGNGRAITERLIDPSDGVTVLQTTSKTYVASGNGAGLLASYTMNGQTTSYTYDALGRVIKTHKSSLTGSCQTNYTVYDMADNVLGTACTILGSGYEVMPGQTFAANITELLSLYDVNDAKKQLSRITLYTYDAMGRQVETTSDAGSTQEKIAKTIYDALNRPIRMISNYIAQGNSVPSDWIWANNQWEDGAGNAIDHGSELVENIISDTVYNARGLVQMRRDVLGNVSLFGYNDADQLVKTVQNALQADYNNDYVGTSPDPDLSEYSPSSDVDMDLIATQEYDAVGNIIKTTDARGIITLAGYDALNRAVKTIMNPSMPDYDRVDDPQLINYTVYSTAPDTDLVSETEYDTMGRVIESRRLLDTRGGDDWAVSRNVYDSLGRSRLTIGNYIEQGVSSPNDWIWSDINSRWEDGAGNVIDHGVDNDQNIISETLYDVQGRVDITRDVDGRISKTIYDNDNRPIRQIVNYVPQGVTDPALWTWANNQWEDGASNAIDQGIGFDQNIITDVTYDGNDQVVEQFGIDHTTTYIGYDIAGRATHSVTSYVSQGNELLDAFNPAKWVWDATEMRWETDAAVPVTRGIGFDENIVNQVSFDDLNRVLETRDTLGNVTRFVYDSMNRRTMVVENYVAQGASDPADWTWTNNQWQDGASNVISFGADNDQNRISTVEYDLAGRVIATRDVQGRVNRSVFDELGRVVLSIQNYVAQGASDPVDWVWANNEWQDGAGNAISLGANFDQNRISQTIYNGAGQVIQTRDAHGTVTEFAYDGSGRRTQVTQASGTPYATTHYTCFDKAGRTLRMIQNYISDGQSPDAYDGTTWAFEPSEHGTYNDRNRITRYTYDNASRRVVVSNPLGETQVSTYNLNGTLAQMSDGEGIVTAYRYDQLKRRTRVIQNFVAQATNPANWIWSVANDRWEDGNGNAIVHGVNNDQNVMVLVSYDDKGRMNQLRDPRGNVTAYEYDAIGRRTKLTNALNIDWLTAYTEANGSTNVTMTYPGANDSTPYDVTRTFDRMGRLDSIQYGDTATTPDVNFAYDIAGNRTQMSEVGTATINRDYTYDAMNRLISAGATGEVVSYTYDERGNRTSMTLPDSSSISYGYDDKGQLISMTDWDGGISQFAYDDSGRHIQTTRPNDVISDYRYDSAGRLTRLTHSHNRETLSEYLYTVDANGNRTQVIENGRQSGAYLATRTYAHSHTAIQPRGIWTTAGQFKRTESWSAQLRIPVVANSLTLTYGTGPDHSIFDIYVGRTLWRSIDGYSAENGEASITIPLSQDGAIDFEIRNRHEKSVASTGYVMRFKKLEAQTYLSSMTIDYTYDGLQRLTSALYDHCRDYHYQYDLAGNRLQEQATVGITTTTTNWTYNDANQISTMQIGSNPVTNFSYDANGNMLSDGQLTYTWDRTNRLVTTNNGAINTHYAYTGDGDRVSQTIGGAVTDYLLDIQPELALVMQESTVSDTLTYLHAPMGIHGVENQAGDWNYHLTDGLGSVRAQVDANQAITATQMYDPYGQAYDVTGTFVGTFGFAGEQMDDSGLSYNRARYYNPALGAFTALDPWEGTPSRPMSLNGYGYVEANPVNLTDPSGKIPQSLVVLAASAAVGAFVSLVVNTVARSGQCGCEMKQAAEKIEWHQALLQGAIGGAVGLATFLGLSSTFGVTATAVGLSGVGVATSFFDMLRNGLTVCNVMSMALSLFAGYKATSPIRTTGQSQLPQPFTIQGSARPVNTTSHPLNTTSPLTSPVGNSIVPTGSGSIIPSSVSQGAQQAGTLAFLADTGSHIINGMGGGNPDAPFPIIVTVAMIRTAMQGAELYTTQKAISLPKVQRIVNRLLDGDRPSWIDYIKVEGNLIIEGNHRYVASRVFGYNWRTRVGTSSDSQRKLPVIDWQDIDIVENDWDR